MSRLFIIGVLLPVITLSVRTSADVFSRRTEYGVVTAHPTATAAAEALLKEGGLLQTQRSGHKWCWGSSNLNHLD
jgi:hypothetical protein